MAGAPARVVNVTSGAHQGGTLDLTDLQSQRRYDPVRVYGRTKLEGERQAARCSRHLIARTSWLYDAWGKNFLNTMLNTAAQGRVLRVVDDQRGAPTTCRALARQLGELEFSPRGVIVGEPTQLRPIVRRRRRERRRNEQ